MCSMLTGKALISIDFLSFKHVKGTFRLSVFLELIWFQSKRDYIKVLYRVNYLPYLFSKIRCICVLDHLTIFGNRFLYLGILQLAETL